MPKIGPVINYPPSRVMTAPMSRCLVVLATLFLANCSFVNNAVWPSLADVPPEVKPEAQKPVEAKAPPPPAPSATQATATLARVTGDVTGLGARLDQHKGRFSQLQSDLKGQAEALAKESGKGDNWAQAQSDLSHFNGSIGDLDDLRVDVGKDAAAGGALVGDLEPLARADLDAAGAQRLQAVHDALDTVLAGLGTLDRDIGAATDRWHGLYDSETARLGGSAPAGPTAAAAAAEAPVPEAKAQPARPVTRKPKPPAPAGALVPGPRDSGDRFKDRQPLVTLSFEDPKLDFEPKLRSLIDKVRAQYPDIAFDIETIGASPQELGKVRALLKDKDIPNDVFVTLPKAGAAPAIKLYPR